MNYESNIVYCVNKIFWHSLWQEIHKIVQKCKTGIPRLGIKLDTFMRKESTWEKIIEINNQESVSWNHEKVLFSCLNQLLIDTSNKIKLGFITSYPQLKDVIKRFEIVKK